MERLDYGTGNWMELYGKELRFREMEGRTKEMDEVFDEWRRDKWIK